MSLLHCLCYINEELVNANMLFIYGERHKSEWRMAVLFANRYLDKRHKPHSIFGSLYRRFCQSGTLHQSTRPRDISQREEVIEQVREAISANPHTNIRYVAQELNIHHTRVHRIILKILDDILLKDTEIVSAGFILPRKILRLGLRPSKLNTLITYYSYVVRVVSCKACVIKAFT